MLNRAKRKGPVGAFGHAACTRTRQAPGSAAQRITSTKFRIWAFSSNNITKPLTDHAAPRQACFWCLSGKHFDDNPKPKGTNMAVCRFGEDSDVYVYYSTQGGIECSRCSLLGNSLYRANNEHEMIAHLNKHKAAGDHVPADAFERLAHPDPE
jgi:hypothetical protein